ncbi:MAG: Bax inhibitor-1/YccA family protein [Phycisphaeraceae bacterium]
MAFASGNPALSVLDRVERGTFDATQDNTMTVQGTINKLFILAGIALITATFAWSQFKAAPQMMYGLLIGGLIGGLVFSLITSFKPQVAHITAPIYAAFEGLFLGALSVVVAAAFPQDPIILQATGITFAILFAMLGCYKTGLIKPTEKFKAFMAAAIGGIMLLYIVNWTMYLFGARVPFLHTATPLGIGISLFIVGIASLTLILHFDHIERAASANLPRQYEWYGAFGIMVTLVWLYLEVLRLLIILSSQRD